MLITKKKSLYPSVLLHPRQHYFGRDIHQRTGRKGPSALISDLTAMPAWIPIVGETGGNLSGVQKQRVAVARALIHDYSILLVDEGTSALEQKNADIIEKSLLANPDLTLILVSHHLTPERKEQFT